MESDGVHHELRSGACGATAEPTDRVRPLQPGATGAEHAEATTQRLDDSSAASAPHEDLATSPLQRLTRDVVRLLAVAVVESHRPRP